MDIKKKLKNIPDSPGVYIFTGEKNEPVYIGKASNLKKRVASYFQNKYHPPRIRAMVSKIRDLDYITTATSAEALIYESSLIKEKKPRYNVELKDDKSYPFLKLTVNEEFPRLFITRDKKKDGALYYGPYTNVKLLKKALRMIQNIFLLRTCRILPPKACLKAQIRQCVAPCDGSVSKDEYKKIVSGVKLFLEGRKKELVKELSAEMRSESKKLNYEKALLLRDRIEALSAMWKGRIPPPPLNREIEDLKNTLGLRIMPSRIEAFDISNIQGKEAVGSMVMFFTGRPKKDEYRRFRIKGISRIDDYAMIREIVRRRYKRVLEEKKKFPDLILIDGGRGHLAAAKKELEKIAPLNIPVISIAKEKEYVYTEKRSAPLKLPLNSPALKLVIKIRDEAHRFAISYHKLLRKKKLFRDKK